MLKDVPVSRVEKRPSPEHDGYPEHRGLAPVEKVQIWYGGFHPFEPTVEGDLSSPCKVCKPWGIGAHCHYAAYEYVAPASVFTVEYNDYEDDRLDSCFYSEAAATARAEVLNRGLWTEYRSSMLAVRDRWVNQLRDHPLTDEDIGFLDAQMIAEQARDKGVRKAARTVRDAFKRQAEGDPRVGLAFGADQMTITFEEWSTSKFRLQWRVNELGIEDARQEVSDGPTDG